MIQSAETRLDGSTLVVRIPMRFQRRGGRKRIVAPDGSEIVPTLEAAAGRHAGQGARAGVAVAADAGERRVRTSVRELADAERISRSYVCRILRLTLLAPDIVERILDGRPTAGLAQFLKPFPVEWEQQRRTLHPSTNRQ